VLLYASLTLDALSVAFQDRTPTRAHDRAHDQCLDLLAAA
jgi:hypothetical protein